MSSIPEIEAAIESLATKDRARLMERLEERHFFRGSTDSMFQLLDAAENDDDSQWLGDVDENAA